ncbi:MAG: HAD family hydrolase [Vicinamibacterales bacterium]
MTRLLLFDIDGTLVLSGGAGGRAMRRAFKDVFGFEDGLTSISMAGRTDAWIVSQMLAQHGLPESHTDRQRFHDIYIEYLRTEIAEPHPDKQVLAGVRELLDVLVQRNDVYLALLTGNYRRGAEVKLEHFDLWRYFAAGAYGDNSHDRNGLLWTAMDNVKAAGGPHVRPSETVIIGDTPLDVAVAVAGGARCLGVGTGGYDVDTLLESGADEAVPDLTDLGDVLRRLQLTV